MRLLDNFAKHFQGDLNLIDLIGIINAEGNLWKQQRRFLHQKLRHFGVRAAGAERDQMEARIMVMNCVFF